MVLKVCVGSSCHLKGSYEVIEKLEEVIKKYNVKRLVELQAVFCLGRCSEGVTVKADEEFLLNIDELPENEQKIIKNAILNSNMQEIDTLIEKLANAEDSEYEELKKDCLNGLKESVTDNKEIGFMNVP